jgi:hypothetical protein
MVQLQQSHPSYLRSVNPQWAVAELSNTASLEEEIDAMISTIKEIGSEPDLIITTCMALMARCTELLVALVRAEATMGRRAKAFRISQLQPVMELVGFEYRAASRLIELRRQEMELSR